jgi:ABC-type molybdate transport system substrate-binding protein
VRHAQTRATQQHVGTTSNYFYLELIVIAFLSIRKICAVTLIATSLLKPALAAEFQLLSAGVIESKTTRDADGAYVLEQVIKGKVHEIGFGAITEILLYAGKGLKLVGPLPADIQNYTSYTAAPLASSQQPALAQQFVVFLSGPVGKPLFVAAGVTD